MRVILVRHYKTLINASGRIMGWGDAPRVADWEKDLEYVDATLRQRDARIDAVYSSFLERSRQTAMYFARRRGIRIIHDAQALNEINYGSLYRKPKGWVAANVPEYKTDADFVFPEGESFRQMQTRSVACISAIAARHPLDTVLVVVHAGVIRGLVCHFLGLDLGSNLKRKVSHRYIGVLQLNPDGRCAGYDEWGLPSGFLLDQAIPPYWAAGNLTPDRLEI